MRPTITNPEFWLQPPSAEGGKKPPVVYVVSSGEEDDEVQRVTLPPPDAETVSYTHLTLPTTSRV